MPADSGMTLTFLSHSLILNDAPSVLFRCAKQEPVYIVSAGRVSSSSRRREEAMDGVRPQPIRVSKRGIWGYAERAAAALRFGPGDSIEPLIARLGGRILHKNA